MKLTNIIYLFIITLVGVVNACGQGTISFNSQPFFNDVSYTESGMWFRVTPLEASPDYMVIAPGSGIANVPNNPTAYMFFIRQYNPYDFVALSLTNGNSFGLVSVQLADPNSPSSSLVPISFVGYLVGGSTVTNTFTTPGGGATTFQNYTFTPAFSSGLLSVNIFAPRWAMDNLVFGNVAPVPEPGTVSLITVGLLAFISRKLKARHKP